MANTKLQEKGVVLLFSGIIALFLTFIFSMSFDMPDVLLIALSFLLAVVGIILLLASSDEKMTQEEHKALKKVFYYRVFVSIGVLFLIVVGYYAGNIKSFLIALLIGIIFLVPTTIFLVKRKLD